MSDSPHKPPTATSFEYEPPERLRRLPTWLAGQVARKAQGLVNRELSRDGLRRQHFTVLASLDEQGPASQAELGRRLWIDRSDLHAVVTELDSAGLVKRGRDERDRRRNVVALTARGGRLLDRLARRVDAAQDELLGPLSAAERDELRRLLAKLVDAQGPG